MAVSSRTYLQLIQAVADNLGARDSGTLTAATATLLTASAYPFRTNRTNESARTYEGEEIYIAGTHAPNPQQIATYSASAGTFVPGIDYTDAPAGTETFDIFLKGVRSAWLRDAINAALRKIRYWSLYPVTLVVDGNMESSGVTDWTATSSALSKVTTVANLPRGARALFVNNSGANGQAQSTTILASPVAASDGDYGGGAREYYLHAWVSADVGQAVLVAYDVTNSATIDSQTWDNRGWGVVDFTFTLPATCEAFAVILRGTGATADTYWTNVICHRMGASDFPLPDWLDRYAYVRGVYSARYNLGLPDELVLDPISAMPVADMGNPNNLFHLDFRDRLTSRPYWYMASRPFAALSADADTTTADREWLEAAATMETAKYLHNRFRDEDNWKAAYQEWFKETARLSRKRSMGTRIDRGRMDRFFWTSVS